MLLLPSVDITVSALCYQPEVGFVWRGQWWERLLYHSLAPLVVIVTSGLIVLWLVNRWRVRRQLPPYCGFFSRHLVLLLLLLALFPGLLVNTILKPQIGRARPIEIIQFGGEHQFTPAFVRSNQGGHSFSSGHAASAAYLVAVAVVLFGSKSPWVALALVYALLIGVVRIIAGGHFLSDVLVSGWLVWVGYWMLRCWISGRCDHHSSK